jgi:hypothetical protein
VNPELLDLLLELLELLELLSNLANPELLLHYLELLGNL